ncbi:mucin-2-like isoform X1 [Anastrepha obliqua]|uniref:mucin-2-like isoform X1 n=1 Tax=Anastrepha obliqua TaxID=95512 RepID=UPI002409F99B|nr:mucin-2-like isoform X1 [Anastrepha obliqua]XP_054726936.1 mucin-2-like isoform X1 [Anastrepha obliqua]
MSYNQKPPGAGGSGMGGGIPPNGPNNSQQVAKTLAGIQQQMQNLVHGQNTLPQSSQADLNVFLQQQRFQNMLKQQQLLHFQMQHQQQQQQHQQQQQQQQKDRGGGGVGIGAGGGGGGEPLALTRTPAAAELLNKTFQHQQQQPNGSAAAPNAALNQFQQQLQALPPNIIQQLQTLQYQMQQHQQQQHQHQQQQHQQHQQQHPSQATPAQHHPTHQQPPPSPQQQQQPLLTAHQQQQLHGQFQQQQQKALQQFQQSLRYFPTAAPTQPTAAPQPSSSGGNKGVSVVSTQPPSQAPPSTAIGNQLKAPNLPPSTQITPVAGNVGSGGSGGVAAQQATKNTVSSTPVTTSGPAAISNAAGSGGGNVAPTVGAKQVPTPSISLLPAKASTSTTAPTAAHQQSKFGPGKTSPVVSAIPSPFPTHFQKPSAAVSSGNASTSNIIPTAKAGSVPTGTATMISSSSIATAINKSPQQSASPVSLTKLTSLAPPPTSQFGPVATAATASPTLSAITAAPSANNGKADSTDQITATQKATNSTPTSPAAPGANVTSAPATDKNVKSTTSEILETVKSVEVVGNTPTKAKEEHSAASTAKLTAAKKITDCTAIKDVNAAVIDVKALKPTDLEISAEKSNTLYESKLPADNISGFDARGSTGGDGKQEPDKPPAAKEQESATSLASKVDPGIQTEEVNKNANQLESTTAVIGQDAKLPVAGELHVTKASKNTDTNSNTPTVSAKKECEEKIENRSIDTMEQKGRVSEKIDIAKAKPAEVVSKSSTDTAEKQMPTNVDKKEASNAISDSKAAEATLTPVEIKSKVAALTTAEVTTDGDKRQSGKVSSAEKPKEEKTKNIKLEKVPASAPALAVTSSAAEEPTQSNSNNHTATKSTKSKAPEAAPDSTNSYISDTNITPVKRSGRQTKTVAKSEKAVIEKSEKVSSTSRPRKSKNGVSSSNNTSAVTDVTASPATPKPDQGPSTSANDRKSSRHRLKTIPFQSPLPELAYITKLSASEASNSPKPMSMEDKLIVFYKNEYMAVRNVESTFYLCQTMQNVYRTSPRISIRWLSEDPNNSGIYIPDFYDHTDIECVLTTVELKRVDKGHLSLPKKEQARIESILKKAIDVEKGLVPRPELTEENPDGLDISLYKDESQIEKKFAAGATPTGIRKSRRSGNSIGTPTTAKTSTSVASAASITKGHKRGRASISGATAGDNGVKSSTKKRKLATKRKSKSKKTTTTDEENDSTDDSDAEYKPNQKNTGAASKASPRAQRSPLAKARAASPISSTTARTKNVSVKLTPTASSRGERANKRKAAADVPILTAENAATPAKRAGGATSIAAATATLNASKTSNTKSKAGQDVVIEANNSASIAKKANPATETTDVVSSTTNASNTIAVDSTTAAATTSGGGNGGSTNNRPTRSRK